MINSNQRYFLEYVKKANKLFTTSELANFYDMSTKAFNQLLCDVDIFYKQTYNEKTHHMLSKALIKEYGKDTLIYQDYFNLDGMMLKGKTYWTRTGVELIYHRLEEKNILPTMDQEYSKIENIDLFSYMKEKNKKEEESEGEEI